MIAKVLGSLFPSVPCISIIHRLRRLHRSSKSKAEENLSGKPHNRVARVGGHSRGVAHNHVGVFALSIALSLSNLCNLRNLWTVCVGVFLC
jgi:hypothetical protein